MKKIQTIVSPNWLEKNRDSNTIILDASKTTKDTDSKKVIPGAIRFDLQSFSEIQSPYPNTILSQAVFQEKARAIGINAISNVIVYDDKGVYTSPRVWWMFKYFGFETIAVLDGGLPAYLKNSLPSQTGHSTTKNRGDIVAEIQQDLIIMYEQVEQNSISKNTCHIDVRSEGRFLGTEPEPRKELISGNIANSFNIPYTEVLKNGTYRSQSDLLDLFKTKNISGENPPIFSCGSGVTACIVLLAYTIVYDEVGPVYDGSWTEWAMKKDLVSTRIF